MDVSPDHESTLIKRCTDVHLNHPLTARRGTHDSRPARWESWTPHPSAPRKGGDRLERAQARRLDAQLHLLDVPERKQMPVRTHGTTDAG
jgi:hypothetical protein